MWRPPKFSSDGTPQPPNNWSQILGEANSAWTYDPLTKEYYLSLFTPEQPDLNWENTSVRAAVHDVMHFWFRRGASGYRMDVINLISKVQSFPDAEPLLGPDQRYHPGSKYYVNRPRLHEYLKELNSEVLSKYDAITVGEMAGVHSVAEVLRTVSAAEKELNMIFIFDLVDIDNIPGKVRMTLQPWTVGDLKGIISKWQHAFPRSDGWNSVFIENHDNPHSVSRYCDDSDEYCDKGAKMLALMQTTLSGTLFVYQGEELGMRNAPKDWDPAIEYKDIESINLWKKYENMYPHDQVKLAKGREILARKSRDHARTPVQWSSETPNAGFCKPGVRPWMRIVDNYKKVNALAQMEYRDEMRLSVWQFWQRGLRNRRAHKDVFVYGVFEVLDHEHEKVFAYMRTAEGGERWLVVLNWCGDSTEWEVPSSVDVEGWIAGTYVKGKPEKGNNQQDKTGALGRVTREV